MSGCCRGSVAINGASAGASPSPTSSPAILVLQQTITAVGTAPVDMFAGQAAPQAPTMVVAADSVGIGGVEWRVNGTAFNSSGGTQSYTVRITFGGVVVYESLSQLQGSATYFRPWTYHGSITRKSATTGWFTGQMFSTNNTTVGAVTGVGNLSSTGNTLSPSNAHSNTPPEILGLDWSTDQRLRFDVFWTANVANLAFAIRGGWVGRFGA